MGNLWDFRDFMGNLNKKNEKSEILADFGRIWVTRCTILSGISTDMGRARISEGRGYRQARDMGRGVLFHLGSGGCGQARDMGRGVLFHLGSGGYGQGPDMGRPRIWAGQGYGQRCTISYFPKRLSFMGC